jgi:hypothetical protein
LGDVPNPELSGRSVEEATDAFREISNHCRHMRGPEHFILNQVFTKDYRMERKKRVIRD